MNDKDKRIVFREREFKGSRLRCLLLTSQEPRQVAEFLSALVAPHAKVCSTELWAPRGFREPDEAKLDETLGFLSDKHQKILTEWWLADSERANTPNWDLVSQCHIEDRPGLILVEAKAHEGELGSDSCGAKQRNHQSIQAALAEATTAWNGLLTGFSLSAETHYQLSNRFAFAWKIADLRIPVVLVYLGFLNAHEMPAPYRLLNSNEQWQACVMGKADGFVPKDAWGRTFNVNGTPLGRIHCAALCQHALQLCQVECCQRLVRPQPLNGDMVLVFL